MRSIHAAALAAIGTMAAQPCLAAELPGAAGFVQGRVGAFAGVRIGVPLGGARSTAPSARLQLGPAYNFYDASGVLVGSRRGAGLELGGGRDGPALAIAGQDAAALKRRLGFKGSTGYIVVGGVLLLLIVVGAAVAGATPRPGPSKGDF